MVNIWLICWIEAIEVVELAQLALFGVSTEPDAHG